MYEQLYIYLYCIDGLLNLSMISNNITLFLKRYVTFDFVGLFFEKLYQQLYICLYCKDWLFNLSLISNNITLFLKCYVKFEGLFFVKLYEQLYIYLYCTFIVYRPNEHMKHVLSKTFRLILKGFIMFSVNSILLHSGLNPA